MLGRNRMLVHTWSDTLPEKLDVGNLFIDGEFVEPWGKLSSGSGHLPRVAVSPCEVPTG